MLRLPFRLPEFIWGNISIFHKLPLTDIVVGSQPLTQTEVPYRITASVTDKCHIIRQLFFFLFFPSLPSSPQIMGDFDAVLKHWGPVEADYTGYGSLVLNRSVTLERKNKIVLFVGRITQTCGQEFKNSSPPVQFKNRIHVLFMPLPV